MKKQFYKLISATLTGSLLLSFAACNKTEQDPTENIPEKSGDTISADSPWYNSEIIDVDPGVDPDRIVDSLFANLVGSDDKYICILFDGWYRVSDWDSIESNSDYMIKNLVLIDKESKQTYKTIDLFSIPDFAGFPETVVYADGMIVIRGWYWESDTNDYYGKYYYLDPETETIVDTRDYDYQMNMQAIRSFHVGEYTIETSYNPLVTPMVCTLKVFAPDGSITDVDISSPAESYYEVDTIFTLDDSTALIPVASTRGYSYFELDLNTYELTKCGSKDYEWLDLNSLLHSYSNGGEVFYTTQNGISKINLQDESEEQVFNYSWCGVNRMYFKDPAIVEYSDDSIILCGQYDSTNMFSSQFVKNFAVIELTKAEENPNAGKQIIELYVADGNIDATISNAIIKYNESSPDCYIEISDRYDKDDYMDYSDINSQDSYDTAYINANASLSDELAVDIINGDGPDIIMNASQLAQLNDNDYLVDLSPYVADLDQDKYFTNIIEGAKTGDELYQLPVCFTIEGIQTDPDFAGASGVGFTTEEYEQFLDDELNGSDVIDSGQALYFVKLFNNMSEVFIKNGKIDITGYEFAELADFVEGNVFENSKSWDATVVEDNVPMEEYNLGENWKTAVYCNCPGISGYLVKRAQITNGTAILGIPSTDGRGPMFGASVSVAVSAQANNVDACVEFVELLLSDDIQTELAYSDKLVLNKDSFHDACSEAIEFYNTEAGSQNIFDYIQGTYVTIQPILTDEDMDSLESVILSCSKMNSADAAINTILVEEMPAYFLGQKDLDDVIEIIRDRAQTVLDER